MNDFLLALGITVAGSLILGKVESSQVAAEQQASCASEGGTWQASSEQCLQGSTPINTQYTMWNPLVTFGTPAIGGWLLTRSLAGGIGAAVGVVGVFLAAFSNAGD